MTGVAACFKQVADALDRLQIPFFVCGSLASSLHGIARATMDIDLVAAVEPKHASLLAAELAGRFYADETMIREALAAGRAFNLIHLATSYKFDIFPLTAEVYAQAQFQRRKLQQLRLDDQQVFPVAVASAEDTLLNKLLWFRAGGEVSDRQWNDILGIIAIQGNRLDREYLQKWARHLGVADLLARAH